MRSQPQSPRRNARRRCGGWCHGLRSGQIGRDHRYPTWRSHGWLRGGQRSGATDYVSSNRRWVRDASRAGSSLLCRIAACGDRRDRCAVIGSDGRAASVTASHLTAASTAQHDYSGSSQPRSSNKDCTDRHLAAPADPAIRTASILPHGCPYRRRACAEMMRGSGPYDTVERATATTRQVRRSAVSSYW